MSDPGCYCCSHIRLCHLFRDWQTMFSSGKATFFRPSGETFGTIARAVAEACELFDPTKDDPQ